MTDEGRRSNARNRIARGIQKMAWLVALAGLGLLGACGHLKEKPAVKEATGAWAEAGSVDTTTGATAAVPTDMELKDREIALLKERLAIFEQQAREELVGRVVYETQLEVAALTGSTIEKPVDHADLTKSRILKMVDDSFTKQYPADKLEMEVWAYALFGALPEGSDLPEMMKRLLGSQVAGLYDPETKKLYVHRSLDIERGVGRTVLAHEICHALQDQNFDLLGMGIEDSENGDRAMALMAIVEGDATMLMNEYMIEHGRMGDILTDLPSMMAFDQASLNASPLVLQEMLIFPYVQGQHFFESLDGRTRDPAPGGDPDDDDEGPTLLSTDDATGRWAIFADPPVTTEQIIHPEKYLAREMPAEIPEFDDEGSSGTSAAVMGELGVITMFETMLGRERAIEVGAGWNGDRLLVAKEEDGTRRLVWVTRWDTPEDAAEFCEALRETFDKRFSEKLEWTEEGKTDRGSMDSGTLTIEQEDETAVRFEARIGA